MNDDIEKCESCCNEFIGGALCTNEETKKLQCVKCYVAWRHKKEEQKNYACYHCDKFTVEMYNLVVYNHPSSYGIVRICGNCFETLLRRMATK